MIPRTHHRSRRGLEGWSESPQGNRLQARAGSLFLMDERAHLEQAIADRRRLDKGVPVTRQVLSNVIIATAGRFKSGRGEFSPDGLREIARLANATREGLKSRFGHPSLLSDGLGNFLGRIRNARLDGNRVRGDLHFDKTAFKTPRGDLASYVLRLAATDPEALAASLALEIKEEHRLDARGNLLRDAYGEPLPPLWHPTKLHAVDIVDEGDGVDGFLSVPSKRRGLLARVSGGRLT